MPCCFLLKQMVVISYLLHRSYMPMWCHLALTGLNVPPEILLPDGGEAWPLVIPHSSCWWFPWQTDGGLWVCGSFMQRSYNQGKGAGCSVSQSWQGGGRGGEVNAVKDKAQKIVDGIKKAAAEEKLEAAGPALEEAEAALNTSSLLTFSLWENSIFKSDLTPSQNTISGSKPLLSNMLQHCLPCRRTWETVFSTQFCGTEWKKQ